MNIEIGDKISFLMYADTAEEGIVVKIEKRLFRKYYWVIKERFYTDRIYKVKGKDIYSVLKEV